MVCCVFQATNLVNNYGQRKPARTFENRQEASNKLYMVLGVDVNIFHSANSGHSTLNNELLLPV